MKRALVAAVLGSLLALGVQAAAVAGGAAEGYTLRGDLQQGAVVFGHAPPGTQVSLNGRALLLTAGGDFVFGFDRDAGPDAELHVTLPGHAETVRHLAVRPVKWKVQRIEGLPPALVNPPPETEQRIIAEGAELNDAHQRDTAIDDFTQKFIWPAQGRISGTFGGQRILNGDPKQPHYGVDMAVPVGTPVHAPAGGIIALAEPDLYFTGGTIVVDHGHGLSSIVVHLSKLLVKPGDRVQQGQVIALSGMTGRATGPHVHWGEYWFGAHVDAQRLAGPMPSGVDRHP